MHATDHHHDIPHAAGWSRGEYAHQTPAGIVFVVEGAKGENVSLAEAAASSEDALL